jgi:putative DNA primase/helicase
MSAADNVVPIQLTARDIENAPRFPCSPDGSDPEDPDKAKTPILSSWQRIASKDEATIAEWRAQYPGCNWGMPTGEGSRVFVLDEDDRAGLTSLLAEHNTELPKTLTVVTPSGGKHYYFLHVVGVRNRQGFWPGLDVRGDGGYVMIPPSTVSGNSYWWEDPNTPVAVAPDWLIERILDKGTKKARTPLGEMTDGDGRNERLFLEGTTLQGRGVADDEILAALVTLNDSFKEPLLPAEVEKIFGSVTTYPKGRPCTELGFAERIVDQHGRDLRWVLQQNRWRSWAGTHWIDDPQEPVRRAKQTGRRINIEAAEAEDERRSSALAKFAARTEKRSLLDNALVLARSEPGVAIRPELLDADPWLFGARNGVIDLRTGEFREARRGDYITKLAGIEYEPGATCPRFERFMVEVFAGDVALVTFVQRAVGYTLTGQTGEQCFFLLHGLGANGKSTLLKVLSRLFGEYARNTRPETFMLKRSDSTSNDIAALVGARLVTTAETEESQRLAESLIKQVTGEDKMTARFLFAEFFDFVPQFKLWMAANHKPVIRGDDHAIWRRIRLIPFTQRFTPNDALLTTLLHELPGIFNWAIRGCVEWQHAGLNEPEAVKAATGKYREEQDVIGAWLEECCVQQEGARGKSGELFESYRQWARGAELRPMSAKVFKQKLEERHFRWERKAGGKWYHGLGLVASRTGTEAARRPARDPYEDDGDASDDHRPEF